MNCVNQTSVAGSAKPCCILLSGLLICLLAGCTQSWGIGSMSSLMPGGVNAGQSEPEIDYEAEAAARKKNRQLNQSQGQVNSTSER